MGYLFVVLNLFSVDSIYCKNPRDNQLSNKFVFIFAQGYK